MRNQYKFQAVGNGYISTSWGDDALAYKRNTWFLYWIKSLLCFVTRWSSWSLVIDRWTVPGPGLRVPSDRAGWKSDLGWNASTRHTWGTGFVCSFVYTRINKARNLMVWRKKTNSAFYFPSFSLVIARVFVPPLLFSGIFVRWTIYDIHFVYGEWLGTKWNF